MRLDKPAVLAWDRQQSQRLSQWAHGRYRRPLTWILARTGDSLTWVILIAIFLWRHQSIGFDLAWAVAGTAVAVFLLKGVFKRQRPIKTNKITNDKYAFPSGHAARSTAVAITLAFAFPAFVWLYLVWAAAVSLARVALARHFLTDVLGGAVVGVVTAVVLQIVL
ncbi:MAG: phosphatase PAP2 family protein [Anaerolineae bacterium]